MPSPADGKPIKVFQLSNEATAFIRAEMDSIYIGGAPNVFVAVDQSGITLRGNTSVGCMGTGQRSGGFFINQMEFADMIPKTIVTMIPSKLPMPPLKFIGIMIAAVTLSIAFLAG
jgi:hypothetical protein